MTDVQGKSFSKDFFGWTALVTLLVSFFLGAAPLLAQGRLAEAARRARADGEAKVTLLIMGSDEDAALSTPEEFLRNKSVVLVTIGSVEVAHSGDTIYTWHIGRIDRVLRTAPVINSEWCTSVPKPKAQFLKPTEVAVGGMGGTVTISGVAVTVDAGELAKLARGAQFLVVGLNCGASTVVLHHGDSATFDVSTAGTVSHRGEVRYPFATQLVALKTPEAIEEYLGTIK